MQSFGNSSNSYKIVFGACHFCNEVLYYPPISIPTLRGIRWNPEQPGAVLVDRLHVCVLDACIAKAKKKYRKELETQDIVIGGIPPTLHRRATSIPSVDSDRTEQSIENSEEEIKDE